MGTTVATNALLERKGVPTVLCITKGFADLLSIGNQTRPKLFDLQIVKPDLLYTSVIEVDERVLLEHAVPEHVIEGTHVRGVTGEWISIEKRPNLTELEPQLQKALASGIKSIAVVLIHSYTFMQHEQMVGDLARRLGFSQVTLSSEIMPMIKAVPRGQTAAADAYLTPLIKQYIRSFSSGFDENFKDVDVSFMMSDGGLCQVDELNGFKSLLSGPAGGVVGYSLSTYSQEKQQPVIGFDMGGTSTDVSRFSGTYEHVFETVISGVSIMAPQLEITTVAAGGGSRLFFSHGLFRVGPESSGADPGPICYRKGGFLSVTDANLFLGRLLPEHFPSIFGPNHDQPLDAQGTADAFKSITREVNAHLAATAAGSTPLTPEQVALGFIQVANETMCRPIRSLTEARGYDPSLHTLGCFGGAGGQHACTVARLLGMRTVIVPRFASVLSAYGLAAANKVVDAQEPCALAYTEANIPTMHARLEALAASCASRLQQMGFAPHLIETVRFLSMRYDGMDVTLNVREPRDGDFAAAFATQYEREYGFRVEGRHLVVEDLRVRCSGKTPQIQLPHIPKAAGPATPHSVTKTYFEDGWRDTPIYLLDKLSAGHRINGPAIIIANFTTVLVNPESTAVINHLGDVTIEVSSMAQKKQLSLEMDPIMLSLFSNRFMSIAEQMGKVLQRTSVSTNIKERLDFSCAIFDPDGGLVANAPHLPVHLGSMADAVNFQIHLLGETWHENEVIVTNHPACSGSHLPDITVMTPVHHEGRPVFYVASRGHHADIGGTSPGSMPPFSKSLSEEGLAIRSFKLIQGGVFNQDGLMRLMNEQSTPPRRIPDMLNDLRAQVAANHRGAGLVRDLIAEYGLDVVVAYMRHVQRNAEDAVREMLRRLSVIHGLPTVGELCAEDFMDDGTPIKLKITLDRGDGTAVFDFTGTGPQILGNCNTPRSVTKSAVLYCLRCLVKREIPLNNGCLIPIKIILPRGSILDPSEDAAVVGGNVLTSQRVTDVILSAFRVVACSQGCMNNFTFGDDTFGYYETIAGGAGAGPSWHGASAVQVHMTNTRITDVEIMERRYPVVMRQFAVRRGSGGDGEYRGGDGVVREVEFRSPLSVGILSERRAHAPKGLNGGSDGARGLNLLVRKDGAVINVGGKNTARVEPGDAFRILTPGGGGYGKAK
eukprot:TRINITY_DN843_c1_g1_i1.p1 TRINITY_DN843_c1_g1~~TRINITY_DN843_c1_g1_i1.p1  ORF type:complete len:1252 (+),score=249.89 TRINITY_DN843_c1_g1_i1:258-3758(+)